MSDSKPNNMVDLFQRRVGYLRLSVTDRCNLRCRYCAPAMPGLKPSGQLLTLDEMYRLVRIGLDLGITKVRLTGGEPLCRKGLAGLVGKLTRLPRIENMTQTAAPQ